MSRSFFIQITCSIVLVLVAAQHWSSSCMVLEWLWGNTPSPRAEKPQQDSRHWRCSCATLGQLWGDIPCPRAKEKPQQDGKKSKIMFRIKPHTCQKCSEGSNKTCVHQDPGERSSDPTSDWPRFARECPEASSGGVGRRWPATGLGALSVAVCAQDL